MLLNRRQLFRAGALAGAAVAGVAAASGAAPAIRRVATLRTTLARGKEVRKGYAHVVKRAGEPHLLRTDAGTKAKSGRAKRRKGVIAFAQISDVHIVDAQSPLRIEWLDRLDDPSPIPVTGILTSSYRAHETLTAHVADAMVREINSIRTGPVTGKKIALTIQTGDNSDNSQYNEVRWNIDLLDGRKVRPDSGNLKKYEGVQDSDPLTYDRAYWHPDGPPPGKQADGGITNYGFPVVKGLLDAARRPFKAQGLKMPWYAAFGNHDGLVQGNFPGNTLQLNLLATGGLKIISPPLGINPAMIANAILDGSIGAVLSSLVLGPGVRLVTPDPKRRLLTRKQIVEEHFETTGLPVGHGFTNKNRKNGTAYYTFDKGKCRFIVLDTVNPNGYYNGSLDAAQFTWLKKLLARSSHKITMIFSHHTSDSMDNPLIATGLDLAPRVTGTKVLAELLKHDHVVAWINGHTHKNEIRPHKRPGGGGMWEINTASHIDWPQQARLIEIADNGDRTLSIFTTVIDHAGPASFNGDLSNPVQLAGLSRELAANDWNNRSDIALGSRKDRNCELVVAKPKRVK